MGFGDLKRFELLSDGTVYARAGVQTNSGGIAGIHVRIEPNLQGSQDFSVTVAEWKDKDNFGAVPGSAVPGDLRIAVFAGARSALEDLRAPIALSFELIDALVHPVDGNPRRFKEAGSRAMTGWLELQGFEVETPS